MTKLTLPAVVLLALGIVGVQFRVPLSIRRSRVFLCSSVNR